MTTTTPNAPRRPAPTGAAAAADAAGARRPASGWLRAVGNVLVAAAVGFVSFVFVAFPGAGLDPDVAPVVTAWYLVGTLAAIGCGVAMFWRRSWPELVFQLMAGAALLLPVGPVAALVALPQVMARGSRRTLAWAIPLAAVATAVPLVVDARRAPGSAVFVMASQATGEITQASPVGYVVAGVVAFGLSVGAGYLARSRAEASSARGVADAAVQRVGVLQTEATRQEEREHLARELHDTVAHHLSLLSLHAAALEVTTSDPAVPEAARSMRASAHQALEEMRVLITSLRDSSEGGYLGSAPSLRDLGRLVEDARAAGVEIAASIELPPADDVPATLTRAVYRIVQESLTNALKHAPGSGVSVQVRAEPGPGVSVAVVNWLPGVGVNVAAGHGSGAGLIGMQERAQALGGGLTAGPHGRMWVVQAWLPWRTA